MHEMALADAVITTALNAADKEGMSEITRMVVRIGELQQIERESFEFALKEVIPANEPRLASTVIDLKTEPAKFRCRPCGREFALADTAWPGDEDESEAIHFVPELADGFMRCPGCNSADCEVLQGRGVSIDSLEGK